MELNVASLLNINTSTAAAEQQQGSTPSTSSSNTIIGGNIISSKNIILINSLNNGDPSLVLCSRTSLGFTHGLNVASLHSEKF